MPGLIIIVLVVLFGGTLAFLGDRVGMKVGKKRLSMFGLRPKYTSMIITVLTGFFIAGLTLVTLTLISEYARTAIFELHSIQERLTSTNRKARDLTVQVRQKQREYTGLGARYAKLRQELAQTENQLNKTQADLNSNKLLNKDLQSHNQVLAGKNQSLVSNNQGLVIQNDNLTQISNYLKQKNNDLNVERERLNHQIQSLANELISVHDRTKVIEEKPLLFNVGEILVARVVEPGVREDKIQANLINPLLQTANELALKQGARIPGKTDYALRIKPARITEICNQLVKLKSKAVLRVIVESNSVKDDPVNVTLEVFPDEIIFKSGEKIVETDLTARYSESEMRDRLLSLLVQAYNKAIAKGIITDEQNLRDVVSISEIVNVINIIKQNPESSFKAALVATRDIYRTGQFKVKIDVKNQQEGGAPKSQS
ncbi:MAG TPA: DUF3084 domain-containing protein [Bacillota bacterium]|nr:DUF3084 domain-containing protein [Bacillota bacterium]